jgi:hypothetical protein
MARTHDNLGAKPHSMTAAFEARAAGAISTVLVAVGASITMVAMAYAIFAALRDPLSPAGASAVTGLTFAIGCGFAVITAIAEATWQRRRNDRTNVRTRSRRSAP